MFTPSIDQRSVSRIPYHVAMPRNWLARIAMNEALGRLRRQRPGVEWTSLRPGVLEAQIIPFPLSAPSDPEKTIKRCERLTDAVLKRLGFAG